MEAVKQSDIDQEVCREIVRNPHVYGHRTGYRSGDSVTVSIAGEAVEAIVEERHLEAVRLFEVNHPIAGGDPAYLPNVMFRIAQSA